MEFGVWDVYEHIPQRKFSIDIRGMPTLTRHVGIVIEDLPFVWGLVRDVIKIVPSYHLGLFILVKFLISLMPVVGLWYV